MFIGLSERSFRVFQSTPSKRRATHRCHRSPRHLYHFNPRPPSGERLRLSVLQVPHYYFNPRPPSGERLINVDSDFMPFIFQSTPSKRRATAKPATQFSPPKVFQSTPSKRRATNISAHKERIYNQYFNPRPPSGERPDYEKQ